MNLKQRTIMGVYREMYFRASTIEKRSKGEDEYQRMAQELMYFCAQLECTKEINPTMAEKPLADETQLEQQ